MTQTAVQWLKSVVESFGNKHELQMSWETLDELFERALKMEDEQLLAKYGEGYDEGLYDGEYK